MSKHAKHHSLHGEVRIFFPPHHEGFPWAITSTSTRITPTNTPVMLFHVVLHRFRWIWASLMAQKMEYRIEFCWYLLKYWTKLNGSSHFLLALNPFCLQCVWLVSQIGLIKKLLIFKFEIGRIFGLFWVTQISVQQNTRFTHQVLVF